MEASAVSYTAIAVSTLTMIVGVVNHKRLRSTCCGNRAEVSLDIEDTTPPVPKSVKPVLVDGQRAEQNILGQT